MGIVDILYQEMNRYRDEKKSDKEKQEIAINLIISALRRFIFDWDSYKAAKPDGYYRNGDCMLNQYADILLDITSQVYDSIVEDVATSLRNNATEMRKMASMPKGIGSHCYDSYNAGIDAISEECDKLIKSIKK